MYDGRPGDNCLFGGKELMFLVQKAAAVCPVCVVAVGSGLWLAEKLGVDELIASLWIGALATALTIVLADKGRKFKFLRSEFLATLFSYFLTWGTLAFQGKIGNPFCRIWGMDKIWLGLTLGVIIFWGGVLADRWLRKKNEGKGFFPFQKVVLPVGAAVLISFIIDWLVC